MQLKTLQTKISSFIVFLQNSGTVDAIITQRVNVLKFLLSQVTDIITKVETGKIRETEIPILYNDYVKFLPYVNTDDPTTNMNNTLPYLLNATGASSALTNLFPYYFGGDLSGAQLARELFDKYAKNMFTDVGYDLNIKLNKKSDSERKVAEEVARALANGTLGKGANVQFEEEDTGGSEGAAPTTVSGMYNRIIQALTGIKTGHTTSSGDAGSSLVSKSTTSSAPPGHFDWKFKASEICEQITKRGLNAYDYGCLNNPDDVSENFSYRGYTKMICNRLGTNYDPGIPTLCGCPPPTWSGWRP